jgi:hypothetical protein
MGRKNLYFTLYPLRITNHCFYASRAARREIFWRLFYFYHITGGSEKINIYGRIGQQVDVTETLTFLKRKEHSYD